MLAQDENDSAPVEATRAKVNIIIIYPLSVGSCAVATRTPSPKVRESRTLRSMAVATLRMIFAILGPPVAAVRRRWHDYFLKYFRRKEGSRF